MIVNSRMAALLAAYEATRSRPDMPYELRELLTGGWHACRDGVLVLAPPDDPILTDGFVHDEVGMAEYDVNDIRVPDEDLLDDPGSYLPKVAARGLAFARAGLHRAKGVPNAETMHASLSTGVDEDFLTHGTTVKFWTRRGVHPDWFDDLERFRIEGIALLDMSDAAGW